MSQYQGDNLTHKATVATAEGVRQVATAAATTQAASDAASVTFYRACRASAIANGVSTTVYSNALLALGTGGT